MASSIVSILNQTAELWRVIVSINLRRIMNRNTKHQTQLPPTRDALHVPQPHEDSDQDRVTGSLAPPLDSGENGQAGKNCSVPPAVPVTSSRTQNVCRKANSLDVQSPSDLKTTVLKKTEHHPKRGKTFSIPLQIKPDPKVVKPLCVKEEVCAKNYQKMWELDIKFYIIWLFFSLLSFTPFYWYNPSFLFLYSYPLFLGILMVEFRASSFTAEFQMPYSLIKTWSSHKSNTNYTIYPPDICSVFITVQQSDSRQFRATYTQEMANGCKTERGGTLNEIWM